MPLLDNYSGWNFTGCALGISARRLLEHMQMGQINPFALITPASAMQPQAFVDIVDLSGAVPTLTGCTWAVVATHVLTSLLVRHASVIQP